MDVEMMPFQEIAPTAGFHTWGEVKRDPSNGNVIEYNITLMSIAMREGEPKSAPKEVKVDDSVLKGQASLIKRLTKLVYATTTELQKAYQDLGKLNDRLVIMAEHDGLTCVYNRTKIEHLIDACLDAYADTDNTSLIMLDIDHFKSVNDTYGHDIGDVTLKTVVKLMSDAVQDIEGSAVGRWGGEEFMVLLPDTDEAKAHEVAEALRVNIEQYEFEEVKHLTASMGVTAGNGTEDRKGIYTRIDDALYEAKETGRNKVVLASK